MAENFGGKFTDNRAAKKELSALDDSVEDNPYADSASTSLIMKGFQRSPVSGTQRLTMVFLRGNSALNRMSASSRDYNLIN